MTHDIHVSSIRLPTDFSSETWETRGSGLMIFKMLKGKKNCHPKILYLAKLSSKSEGKIKTFSDKQKLREFVTTRPDLQETPKGVLQGEMEGL